MGPLQKTGASGPGPDCDHRLPGLFHGLLARLTTDIQTIAWHLDLWLSLYELKDSQQMKPYTSATLASPLYKKGFEPTTRSQSLIG